MNSTDSNISDLLLVVTRITSDISNLQNEQLIANNTSNTIYNTYITDVLYINNNISLLVADRDIIISEANAFMHDNQIYDDVDRLLTFFADTTNTDLSIARLKKKLKLIKRISNNNLLDDLYATQFRDYRLRDLRTDLAVVNSLLDDFRFSF
jgi:hypothetical protein